MPVNTPNSVYTEFIGQWARCRDVHNGTDAVKSRGTMYLPMLEGMRPVEALAAALPVDPTQLTAYDGYKHRAMFYPAMSRTVLGLVGMLFGKPPTLPDVDDKIKKQFDDVTMDGSSLHIFAIEAAREILITGRVGVLVDYASQPLSADDDRPYWVMYQAEDIINWRTERIGGKMMLTMIVLRERGTDDSTPLDEFAEDNDERYRVLRLTGNAPNLVYTSQIYRQNSEKKSEYIAGEIITPQRRGAAIPFIPFQFIGPTQLSTVVEHPPLVDLADVNLSHYRTSADREHGAHFTALPTPWIRGHSLAPGETLGVGSGTAWVFPDPAAEAGMLEFSGAGLSALKDIMEEKRLLMATLGARMLETQRNVQEAAQTQAMRHAGEGSALGIMADTLGKGLSNVVAWHLWWLGRELETIKEEQRVTLNPEMLEQLTPDDISKLVAAWQAGAISYKTLYYNLQWGEWTRPDVTAEDEQEDIEDETPDEPTMVPGVPPNPDDPSQQGNNGNNPPIPGEDEQE